MAAPPKTLHAALRARLVRTAEALARARHHDAAPEHGTCSVVATVRRPHTVSTILSAAWTRSVVNAWPRIPDGRDTISVLAHATDDLDPLVARLERFAPDAPPTGLSADLVGQVIVRVDGRTFTILRPTVALLRVHDAARAVAGRVVRLRGPSPLDPEAVADLAAFGAEVVDEHFLLVPPRLRPAAAHKWLAALAVRLPLGYSVARTPALLRRIQRASQPPPRGGHARGAATGARARP